MQILHRLSAGLLVMRSKRRIVLSSGTLDARVLAKLVWEETPRHLGMGFLIGLVMFRFQLRHCFPLLSFERSGSVTYIPVGMTKKTTEVSSTPNTFHESSGLVSLIDPVADASYTVSHSLFFRPASFLSSLRLDRDTN
jgi:hypothetical protein